MWHSLVGGYRYLQKRPDFFGASVLTLALCVGATSSVFSLIDAVLLRPLPYPQGDRLVALFESNPRAKVDLIGVAPVRVEEWNRMTGSFEGIAGMETANLTDTSGSLPEKVLCGETSPRFFSVLGVPPLIGREFTPSEERYGGPNAALISEAMWRRRFDGNPNVLGKALKLNGSLYPIVGVMPAPFREPMTNDEIDVWLPDALPPVIMRNREGRFYSAIARLKAGISPASAQADLDSAQRELAREYPLTDGRGWRVVLKPLKDATVGRFKRGLWILFGAVGLLLLIGCANVACLLLGQAHRREREIAIRFSLGARRGQVIRQLLSEAFLVALCGTVLGLFLSTWETNVLQTLAAGLLPRSDQIIVNWQVAGFTLLLSVLTTFLFGLAPAFMTARENVAPLLAHGSRTQAGESRQPFLQLLAAGQVMLAVVLLIGAGLLIRTMANLTTVPLGFQTKNILTLHVSASWGEQRDYKGVQHRMKRTLQAFDSIPGVESAAIVLSPPGGAGSDYNLELQIAGRDSSRPGEKLLTNSSVVSASYFRTLGIPMLSGRICQEALDSNRPEETMVNRQFAEKFFPNQNPVGHTLIAVPGAGSKIMSSVIAGVVGDVRDTNRIEGSVPTVYWCTLPGFFPDPLYLIKTHGPPMAIANAVRQRLKQIEPGRAVYGMVPLDTILDNSMGARRLQAMLLSVFGLMALLLASIGIYGVINFYVSQRTREIGLRVALGARPDQIFQQIFRKGAAIMLCGLGAGIAGAIALSRLMASLLFNVGQWDAITFTAAPVLLMAVAALAIYIPARRAMRVDPMVALREE